jgi:hypothetical protein
MPQSRNSNRNASLDQKKTRAAGRQNNPRSPKGDLPLGNTTNGRSTRVGGASGKDGHVRSRSKGSALTKGGGGGGAAFSIPKD